MIIYPMSERKHSSIVLPMHLWTSESPVTVKLTDLLVYGKLKPRENVRVVVLSELRYQGRNLKARNFPSITQEPATGDSLLQPNNLSELKKNIQEEEIGWYNYFLKDLVGNEK